MIQEFYSAAQLAGLPGMPGTVQRVNAKAKRESWHRRPRRARGGGWEYHIDSLPAETRQQLRREAAISACNHADPEALAEAVDPTGTERRRTKEDGLRALAALPADHPKKARARAREWVLRRWADFANAHQVSPPTCLEDFIAAYQIGDIVIPESHQAWLPQRNGARTLDRATLYRWRKTYTEQGLAGLAGGYGKNRGKSKIAETPELQKIVLGCIFQQPHITAKKIKAYLEARHADLDIVSEKSIDRFVARWRQDNAQLWTYLTNPDQWKNIYMSAFGSQHEDITQLNQLWEMDSTPADWMLIDGRHSVVGVIDLYSRRLKFRVSKTSRSVAVALTFRDGVLAWGRPKAVRTDNGQDYVAEYFDGVLRDLEIVHELCVPFASEQKATIERSMRTMSHGILDLLPGFIGHNVAERKVIEARKSFADRVMTPGEVVEVKMTAAELQEKLDAWCEHVYARDPHSGLDGRTPFEVATAWRGEVERINDPRALDALLAEVAGVRRVTKKGVRFEHYHYIAPELVAFIGCDVRLKSDPDDIGRLFVYDTDGAFVCIAQAHELLGISRAEAAAAAKASQKRLLSQQREELKEARRAVRENIAEAVLEHRIQQSEKVSAFPAPSTEYSTPALSAAGEASRAASELDAPREAPPVDEAAHAQLVDQFNAKEEAEIVDLRDDGRRNYAYWCRLDKRLAEGGQLTKEDHDYWINYRRSTQWQSMKEFFEAFDLDVEDFA